MKFDHSIATHLYQQEFNLCLAGSFVLTNLLARIPLDMMSNPTIHPNLNLRVDNHTAQNWAMVVTLHNYPILSRECI